MTKIHKDIPRTALPNRGTRVLQKKPLQGILPHFSYSASLHQFVVTLQVDESCKVRLLMHDNVLKNS
jgi:hypothetical protein